MHKHSPCMDVVTADITATTADVAAADVTADITACLQSGRVRSPLEGVPFAVKDVIDATPYPTTLGTSYMGTQ